VIEFLHKGGLLPCFLELIGTSSDYVIVMNGLHYMTKLFSMVRDENTNPIRKDQKSIERDLKALTAFFIDRPLFIKIHMIYKTFSEAEKPWPGAAFQELAKFYDLLNNCQECSKLKKHALKKDHYKNGIAHITSMFASPVDDSNIKTPPPPGPPIIKRSLTKATLKSSRDLMHRSGGTKERL